MLSYAPTSYLIISETFCSFFVLIGCGDTWNVPLSLTIVRYIELYPILRELWLYDSVIVSFCEWLILWFCDCITMIVWQCDCMILWFCDSVILWQCDYDCMILWFCHNTFLCRKRMRQTRFFSREKWVVEPQFFHTENGCSKCNIERWCALWRVMTINAHFSIFL